MQRLSIDIYSSHRIVFVSPVTLKLQPVILKDSPQKSQPLKSVLIPIFFHIWMVIHNSWENTGEKALKLLCLKQVTKAGPAYYSG